MDYPLVLVIMLVVGSLGFVTLASLIIFGYSADTTARG